MLSIQNWKISPASMREEGIEIKMHLYQINYKFALRLNSNTVNSLSKLNTQGTISVCLTHVVRCLPLEFSYPRQLSDM